MRRIAAEETSHAVLSWDLDSCVRRRLSASERAKLDDAVHAALDDAEHASTSPVHDDLVRLAGLPAPPIGRALLEAARRELFAPRVDRYGWRSSVGPIHSRVAGSAIENVAPRSGLFAAQILPP